MKNPNALCQGILLIVLIFAALAPIPAWANKTMFIQATLNPSQMQQGVSVAITGKVFDSSGAPVSNAVVSIQVTNPQASSVHLAVAYSAPNGTFEDNFVLPVNSPGGNYTAYLVADKPGFDTARLALGFNYSSPDFALQPAIDTLSLHQGDVGRFSLALLSIRGFNNPVTLTALNLPSGVNVQFSPASVTPAGSTQLTISVAQTAETGNFTITILAVSGPTIHTASFQLLVTPGPVQLLYVVLPLLVVLVVILLTVARRRMKRSQKRAAVESLLRESEADKGYVATARVIARLEELRATGRVDESTYRKLKREYEKRLEKSK